MNYRIIMTAEEQMRKLHMTRPPYEPDDITDAMIQFAKYHVEQALKSASDKAYIIGGNSLEPKIDKDSIIYAYPLENIK